MNRICLFPGTFDPLTLGHVDIINRALPLFDKIVVGIGINNAKAPMFSPEQRVEWIKEIYKDEERVEGAFYEGLTINFCKKIGAHFILRGIRYVSDFEYEKTIADATTAKRRAVAPLRLPPQRCAQPTRATLRHPSHPSACAKARAKRTSRSQWPRYWPTPAPRNPTV